MPRLTSGVRLGIVTITAAVLLGSCSDNKTSTTGPGPGALEPSFAISVSSSNFQQCANGGNGGQPCTYINGVLNDSKSAYRESDVIGERFVIPELTIGHVYRLVFDYGAEKALNPGHMNYDFIAGWNTTLGLLANPCGDPLGNNSADIRAVCNTNNTIKSTHSGANADFQVIPDAVFTTNAPLGLGTELQAAIDRFQTVRGADAVRFDILGGSFPASAFDNVTYTVNGDDVTGRFTVRFTAGQTTVMLLWGGHFADSRDYRVALWDDDKNASTPEHVGNLTGAAGQSGAPFHFTQQYLKDLNSGDSTGIGSLSNNVQGSVLELSPKANISILGTATNGIGEPHTFTVALKKDLDDGAGEIAATGEHVNFTLTAAGGAVVSLDAAASTCDDLGANSDSNGQCTIVFTSNSAGTVTGTASATLSLNGVSVNVLTDGSGGSSISVIKTFVAGTIKWLKHDGNAQLLGGAVFTICRTHLWDSDLNSGAGGYTDITPDVCFDVTDDVSGTDNTNAPPADRDGTAGEFELGALILGKYTVTEKTAPSGYILDPDTENADLSTTTTSVTISTAFVNINPNAFITIGPATATNDVGQAHTFTATMTAIPNGGSPVSIPDFTISVSPTPSTPGSTTCTAFDAATNSKTCTRTINSTTPGTFTANASATATVGSVTLTRDTDPATTTIGAGPNGSGPAVKTYVAPNLAITKTPDQLGDADYLVQPLGTAKFTITVTNTGSGAATNVVVKDTLPNSGLTWSESNASCSIATIDIDPGAPVVNRQELTCTLATLAALTGTFTVEVSATVPANFIQVPPSPAGTPLQIDGDLIDNGAGNDWENVGVVCQTAGCRIDDPSGQNDGSFGQGTSEDTPVPSIVGGGIPPEKSDLLRFYITTERFVTSDYLYLAWERVQEPNGTTNMDFELNQSTSLSANGVTPVRTAGDILVKYDLSKGGVTPVLGFHRWVTASSAGGQTAAQACEATNKFPCWGKGQVLTTDVAGAINSASVTDPINPGAPRSLDARTFGEARINLQASGIFQTGVCLNFGRAYLKSRSSDSFTSAIKDYIAPVSISINTCQDVLINNLAWVSASNFAPAGGNAGDGISDSGQIKVQAPTASLNVPTTGRLVRAVADDEAGSEIPMGTDAFEANDRLAVQRNTRTRTSIPERRAAAPNAAFATWSPMSRTRHNG